MDSTVFFYDWNYDEKGHFWPGLIYSEDKMPYCRPDLTDDEMENGDDDGDTQFNDDKTRESTYLTAAVLDGNSAYQNNEPLTYVKLTAAGTIGWSEANAVWYDNKIHKNTDTNLHFYDIEGYIICGMDEDGEVLDFINCTSENLIWNKDKNAFQFKYDNHNYDLYSSKSINGTYNKVTNLATFATDGTIVLFIPPVKGKVDAISTMYIKKTTMQPTYAIQHRVEIVAMYAEVRDVDHLNVYSTNPTLSSQGKIEHVQFHMSTWTYKSHHVWAKDLRKEYPPKVSDDTKAEEVLDAALKEPVNPWKTPDEFYTDWKPTEKVVKGPNGFIKAFGRIFGKKYKTHVIKETQPVWFWCNTLRNWCTYKRTKHHTFELFLWNGKNGWDPATKIILPVKKRALVLTKYLYDVKRFIRGPFINAKINYNNMPYAWRSIKLTDDTKFSQYDEDTFQTVKLGKTYLNNKGTRRYPFSIGIPPVFRTVAGEICLLYYLRIPGMQWWSDLIYKEHIDFINSVCQAYMGKGEDKTISQHWKRFNFVKDISEEYANEVITDEKSTLIYKPEINTIREDNEVLDISFTIPRQYFETLNGGDESYVEEWSR